MAIFVQVLYAGARLAARKHSHGGAEKPPREAGAIIHVKNPFHAVDLARLSPCRKGREQGEVQILAKKIAANAKPIMEIVVLSAVTGTRLDILAPKYPPAIVAHAITNISGQWIRPAKAKANAEIAEITTDRTVFKPFIAARSFIPQSENSANIMIPSPPLK